jgi:hypothetical protein
MPETGVYFVSPRRMASIAACFDVVRGIEIRLPDGEADHVPALRFQVARLLRHHDGGRRLNARKGVGQEGHRTNLQGWLKTAGP